MPEFDVTLTVNGVYSCNVALFHRLAAFLLVFQTRADHDAIVHSFAFSTVVFFYNISIVKQLL